MNAPLTKLDIAIAKAMSHLRDLSLRDGVQSWDGNLWPIDDILPVVKELNKLAVEVGKVKGKLPPVEVWGGQQVGTPARVLREDPFLNLKDIHEAGPDLELQCLFRGRQGFGFIPISPEIQEKAVETSAALGMKVYRAFDMMNDLENLEPIFKIAKKRIEEHGKGSIILEGAISYTKKPEKKDGKEQPSAWTREEYADYAVKLAERGSDEIVIKNFAGKDDDEMPELIKALRVKLNAAGFNTIPINLHTHGEKPEVLVEAIKAGANKVDVAIGALSGGPSHTDMRNVVNLMLKEQGFNQKEIDGHPAMQQLAKIESVIRETVHRKTPQANGEMKSFDDKRTLMRNLFANPVFVARIARSPMAFGALSDLAGRISEPYFEGLKKQWSGIKGAPQTREEFFIRILDTADDLWQKAGQISPVTPGAKILSEQATPITRDKIIPGLPVTMTDYTADFMDVATGRFGRNLGMEKKAVGDVKWRDALLMFRTLKAMDEAVKDGSIKPAQRLVILNEASLGAAKGMRLPIKGQDGPIELNNPILEKVLLKEDEKFNALNPPIERLRDALTAPADPKDVIAGSDKTERDRLIASIPLAVRNRLLAELTPGRSPDPTDGIDVGMQQVEELEKEGFNIDTMRKGGKRISDRETVALTEMLLRETGPDGKPNYQITDSLVKHIAQERAIAAQPVAAGRA